MMKNWRKMPIGVVADMVARRLFGRTSSLSADDRGIDYCDFRLVTWGEVEKVMESEVKA